MGAIYMGLRCTDGYLLATNDIFGEADDRCAIHRVNGRCAALIVTARDNFLPRLKELLDKIPQDREKGGLSERSAAAMAAALSDEFRRERSFEENPLPFLLLLVGYGEDGNRTLEHVFVRNRVVKVFREGGAKRYATTFDVHPPAAAGSLFYGHADVAAYLHRQLPPEGMDRREASLFASFSFAETRKIDPSIRPGMRMATLSENDFAWTAREELARLAALAGEVDSALSWGFPAGVAAPAGRREPAGRSAPGGA